MKFLDSMDANAALRAVGLGLNERNGIVDLVSLGRGGLRFRYRPRNDHLLNFSQCLAAWLPKGDWKIFQIDSSASLALPQHRSLFGGLLFGGEGARRANVGEPSTIQFVFGEDEYVDDDTELLIANLMFSFLRYEASASVISAGSTTGEYITLSDGFVYFCSRDKADIRAAQQLVAEFEANPKAAPLWIRDVARRWQREPAFEPAKQRLR